MPVRTVTARDTQPLTVNALFASPLIIPERILAEFENQFVMDQILRDSGRATGGAVQFRVATGLFADDASEIVNPGAEIPLATVSRGDIQSKAVAKRALGVAIDREMRARNAIGDVENQIQLVRNTIVRDVDAAFLSTLTAAITLTRAATAAWTVAATATVRKDILAAKRLIATATVTGTTDNYLAYVPDTILLNPVDEANLLGSAEFTALLYGSVNASNVASLRDIPQGNILGLRPLVSVSQPAGTALVIASKVVGGYADEFPLEATELYEAKPNQLWRSDVSRSTVGFIDQPKAICSITGI